MTSNVVAFPSRGLRVVKTATPPKDFDEGWRLAVAREALFCILGDAPDLTSARAMAAEALCDIEGLGGQE